ncbi:hypothetical protein [Brevibacillus nitrificans]|uniref:hypothetical protein n=1 Tax=Brevibacillus TaxID=55080 RepID=UPI0028610727|nr:hypothetical protein [Brevibacillus nitrificans]MDR7314421.1 hypothetical protein [Brevibacillus nitrificans]
MVRVSSLCMRDAVTLPCQERGERTMGFGFGFGNGGFLWIIIIILLIAAFCDD